MEIINQLDQEVKHSMRIRVITSLVLVFTCLPCLFLGDIPFLVLVFALAIIATFEILQATKKRYNIFIYILCYVIVISLIYWTFVKNIFDNPAPAFEEWYYMGTDNDPRGLFISTVAVGAAGALLFLAMILDKNFTMKDAAFIMMMLIVLALSFQAIYFLRYYPLTLFNKSDPNLNNVSSWKDGMLNQGVDPNFYHWFFSSMLILYVVIGAFITDMGAYFIGVLFGKHKINERISPKKTWEGFIGGFVFSFLFSFMFALGMALGGFPILPFMTVDGWYNILIISLIMPIFANLGDFAFSAIKREFQIKDFGKIFPGHGGVLDRIDSLLFTCAVVAIVITFMGNNWNFMI